MKTTKIYENEKEIYSGNCYVNTVIFRGRIYGDFKEVGQSGVKFSLQLSNGKDEKAENGINQHLRIAQRLVTFQSGF